VRQEAPGCSTTKAEAIEPAQLWISGAGSAFEAARRQKERGGATRPGKAWPRPTHAHQRSRPAPQASREPEVPPPRVTLRLGRYGSPARSRREEDGSGRRAAAILPKPVKTPFGLLRVFSVVIPFLYVGTQISKNFAALLEEHDIFVPEDDDDDD
ncbi:single-pass membrane protein with aspartate-rich tail 1, partial [Columba livia]